MFKGNFLMNVMDEPIHFKYETEIPPARYKEFDFIFVPGGETIVMRGGNNVALCNFLLDDVVRQRVLEQTGAKPLVIAVSVT